MFIIIWVIEPIGGIVFLIGILIVLLIIGILLVSLSSVLYYYDALGFLGFSVILLQGIVVLLVSAYALLSWQTKWKDADKTNNKTLKRLFAFLAIVGVVVLIMGVIGYLLSEFGIFALDRLLTNTLLAFLVFGSLGAVSGFLSMIFVERARPRGIQSAIIEQQNLLTKLKRESEDIGSEIRSIEEYLKRSQESAVEIELKDKQELERR